MLCLIMSLYTDTLHNRVSITCGIKTEIILYYLQSESEENRCA